jgi:hypothetical protein
MIFDKFTFVLSRRLADRFTAERLLNPSVNDKLGRAFFREDFFDPTDDAACQAHFDPVGMGGGPGENIFNDSFG